MKDVCSNHKSCAAVIVLHCGFRSSASRVTQLHGDVQLFLHSYECFIDLSDRVFRYGVREFLCINN